MQRRSTRLLLSAATLACITGLAIGLSCLGEPEGLCGAGTGGLRTCPDDQFCNDGKCADLLPQGETCELDGWCKSSLCENRECASDEPLDCPPTDDACPCPEEKRCALKRIDRHEDFEDLVARGCTHIESLGVRFADEPGAAPELRCIREIDILTIDGALVTDLQGFNPVERVGTMAVRDAGLITQLGGLQPVRALQIEITDNDALETLAALDPKRDGRTNHIGGDVSDGALVLTDNPALSAEEVCCTILSLRDRGWRGVATVDVDCDPWLEDDPPAPCFAGGTDGGTTGDTGGTSDTGTTG